MIAMALALKPDILIADEPTTALDVTVQAQILALLEELQAETGMGLLLITHDLGVVAEMADRVVVMNPGEIVETGSAARGLSQPAASLHEEADRRGPGHGGDVRAASTGMKPILRGDGRAQDASAVSRRSKASVLTCCRVRRVAIVGESGSGKSTLAKTLLRLEEATGGRGVYKGRDLFTMPPRELFDMRRDIQMVFQDPTQSLNPRMSVYRSSPRPSLIHRDILPKDRWKARVRSCWTRWG